MRVCVHKKKRENSQDMLSYLESKRGEAQNLLGLYLQAMADPDKIAEATLPQLSTAFGTIVDKFAMLGDQSNIEAPDDGLLEALSAAADISPPDDVEMLPEEEDDHAEKVTVFAGKPSASGKRWFFAGGHRRAHTAVTMASLPMVLSARARPLP